MLIDVVLARERTELALPRIFGGATQSKIETKWPIVVQIAEGLLI